MTHGARRIGWLGVVAIASAGACSPGPEAPGEEAMQTAQGLAGSTTIRGLGGRCLDVANASAANGATVQLWDCNGGANQQWTVNAVGTAGEIRSGLGKCLDVQDGSTADGAKVQLYDCNGTTAQRWTLTSAGELRGPGSKCLDVADASSVNGARILLWTCLGAANQKWQVASTSTSNGLPRAPSIAVPSSWGGTRVVMADDFNGNTLSSLWGNGLANQGFGDNGYSKGANEHELQIYWPKGLVMGDTVGRPSRVILKATPQPQGLPGYYGTAYFASGAMTSYTGTGTGFASRGFQWNVTRTPLIIEARISLPGKADNASPFAAFWGSSANAWTFEEDWVEQLGSDNRLQSTTHFITGSAQWCNDQTSSGPWGRQPSVGEPHVFTVLTQTDGSFTVYSDGVQVASNPARNTSNATMGLILNYALDAQPPASWQGDEMVIDYVMA